MRVVVDTNVLVSGLLFGGLPREIVDHAQTRVVTLCFTENTLEELLRVLLYPKFEKERLRMLPNFDTVFDGMLSGLLRIPEPENIPTVVTSDPSDNKFLACATAARAEYIVSGDKHLLNLKNFAGIPIVTPRQFLRRFK